MSKRTNEKFLRTKPKVLCCCFCEAPLTYDAVKNKYHCMGIDTSSNSYKHYPVWMTREQAQLK